MSTADRSAGQVNDARSAAPPALVRRQLEVLHALVRDRALRERFGALDSRPSGRRQAQGADRAAIAAGFLALVDQRQVPIPGSPGMRIVWSCRCTREGAALQSVLRTAGDDPLLQDVLVSLIAAGQEWAAPCLAWADNTAYG